jgi:hypothetical protein
MDQSLNGLPQEPFVPLDGRDGLGYALGEANPPGLHVVVNVFDSISEDGFEIHLGDGKRWGSMEERMI